MSGKWYCKLDGRMAGPFLLEELKFLTARGKLSREDLVSQGTDGPWSEAASIPGLFATPTQLPARTPQRSDLSTVPTQPSPVPRSATPGGTPVPVAPTGAAQSVADSDGPPARLPTDQRDDSRRSVLIGVGIGTGLVLLILLILLLTRLNRPSPVADSRGSPSRWGSERSADGGPGDDEAPAAGAPETGNDQEGASATTAPEPRGSGDESGTQAGASDQGVTNGSTLEVPNETEEAEEATEAETEGPSADTLPDDSSPPSPGVFSIRGLTSPPVAEVPEAEEAQCMFGGRSSSSRSRLVRRGGGTKESEAAVERGLKWLATHQSSDGRWSLHRFTETGDCDGECTFPGTQSDVAGTALALLPFLGAGETHRKGKYRDVVQSGLDWLIDNQQKDGSFRDLGGGRMYAQGQAAIALCEALAMTREKRLRDPAQRAIAYIVEAQHPAGGWRYSPGMAGDTSVLGWQIMALESAQAAKLKIPRNTFPLATQYLDCAQTDKTGGLYAYTPGGGPTPPMTAEGLLCRQYTGWHRTHAGLQAGVEYLLQSLPSAQQPNMYYWYYATQVMHHFGGQPWQQWNSAMRETLIDLQETEGHRSGSWAPRGVHDGAGGRLYMTALATCTLEVYYRHASLYSKKD